MTTTDTAAKLTQALTAFSDNLPEGFSVALTDAEIAKRDELLQRPTFAALDRNPVVAAMRRATRRTRLHLTWNGGANGLSIGAMAFRCNRKGLPTGSGKMTSLAQGLTVAQAVAVLDAL